MTVLEEFFINMGLYIIGILISLAVFEVAFSILKLKKKRLSFIILISLIFIVSTVILHEKNVFYLYLGIIVFSVINTINEIFDIKEGKE